MRCARVVLTTAALLSTSCAGNPIPAGGAPQLTAIDEDRIVLNDNVDRAGTLRAGELTLELEVREGRWYLLGEDSEPGRALAFGEAGRPLQIPAPMIRVPVGTAVRVLVRNPLDATLVVHGLSARRQAGLDSLVVPPGGSSEARFSADAVGTYYYWATTTGLALNRRIFEDSHLSGALIVDPPGGSPPDRVLMLGEWTGERLEDGSPDFDQLLLTINGRPWPHTERMRYHLGDSIRWRVINVSPGVHPMHLHGFHFRVDARGDLERDTIFWPAQRRLAVTERLLPGETVSLVWSPDRPGAWLFHCHLIWHVTPNARLGAQRLSAEQREHELLVGHAHHDPHNHVQHGMGGLMMVANVVAPDGWTLNEPAQRRLRLFVQSDSMPGQPRRFSYVLQRDEREPAADSVLVPGSPIVLRKGEPASIMVINRSTEPTQIHWHGLELQNYFDGVVGLGGHPGMPTPAIMPGDSFEVRVTPPRAGSFMYHTHMNDIRQLSHGLYGPFIVLEPEEEWDPARDIVLMAGSDGVEGRVLLNGRGQHEPLVLRAGQSYRLRLMNVTLGAPNLRMRLVRDGAPEFWRALAKDGADLPLARRVLLPTDQPVSIGETFDFLYSPAEPGELQFELRSGVYRLMAARTIQIVP
jgi:manganese oxidase